MPKEEWGTKRLCPHCSTRFYDLNNNPMACPACGNQFTLESLNDGRGKTLVAEKTSTKDDNLAGTDDDLDTDAGDLDDDLLEDDDDDADVSLDEIADVASDDDE